MFTSFGRMLEISKIDFNLKWIRINYTKHGMNFQRYWLPFNFDMNIFWRSQKFSISKPLNIFGFPSPLVQIFEIFGLTIETYSLTYMYFPYLNFTNSWKKNSKNFQEVSNNANNSWRFCGAGTSLLRSTLRFRDTEKNCTFLQEWVLSNVSAMCLSKVVHPIN